MGDTPDNNTQTDPNQQDPNAQAPASNSTPPSGNEEDDKKKKEGEEQGGFLGFLGDNMGLLGGLALGGILMFATGGSGLLGMLLPLIIGAVAGLIMDDNGLMGGVKNMFTGGPSQEQSQSEEQQQSQGKAKTVELTVAAGAQLQAKTDKGVLSGVDEQGNAVYAEPTGTPPRGPDVTLVENGMVEGNKPAQAAYKYTGHVEGEKFVITGMQAAVPGSGTPPKMTTMQELEKPIELPIGENGSVALTQPEGSALDAARAKAVERAQAYNKPKDFTVTKGEKDVSIELDPVVRDGQKYQTRMIGTLGADGDITFDRAELSRIAEDDTKTIIPNVKGGTNEFKINPPVIDRLSEDGEVTLPQGRAETIATNVTDYGIKNEKEAAAAATERRKGQLTELTTAIDNAPDASQSINGLQQEMAKDLKAAGVGENAAVMNSLTMSDWYAKSSNRSMTPEQMNDPNNPASLRSALRNQPANLRMTDQQIDNVMGDLTSQHTEVSKHLNDKARNPSGAGSTGAEVDIPLKPLPNQSQGVTAPTGVPTQQQQQGTSAGVGP